MSISRRPLFYALAAAIVVASGVGAAALWRNADEPAAAVPARSEQAQPGTMSEMNFILSDDRIEVLKPRAVAGDNRAAVSLAEHYADLGQRAEEKRWHGVAANRGGCESMGALREIAGNERDRRARAHWNDMMRRNACTWGKTYPMFANQNDASMPLWD